MPTRADIKVGTVRLQTGLASWPCRSCGAPRLSYLAEREECGRQLWLTLPLQGLGWVHSENSVAGCYVEPIDTWADMTHLLLKEHWSKADGVSGLAYFCGVLEDVKNETPAEANARVKVNVERFLVDHVGPLWPRAVRAGKIYWPTLADPGRGCAM